VILELVGGVGVFLLGMVLLTEGLRALAGRSLRRGLARFTGNRYSAIVSGALATAVVQSSSATTITTIGLVSAGLLPVLSAVGVIVGANLGTTSTAWIVAYFGLKLDISAVAMVAVAIGAIMRLLGRGRMALAALPVAGFGLLFVGIGMMQSAMVDLAAGMQVPADVGGSLAGMLFLVVIGAAMTLVMQSSSAAVATTLTALSAGVVGLDQAAALVIGQNIGTTPKALLASIGAAAPARRTAAAHIVFNVATAVVALVMLPAFVWVGTAVAGGAGEPALTLAVFHTLFNLVGVALVLPWLPGFTRLVSSVVPERGPQLTRYLHASALDDTHVAVKAVRTTLLMTAAELADETRRLTTPAPSRVHQAALIRLGRIRDALDETRAFLSKVRADPSSEVGHRRHVSVLHALDHLQGAVARLAATSALERLRSVPEARELRDAVHAGLAAVEAWCPVVAPDAPADEVLEALANVTPLRRRTKRRVLRLVATGDVDPDDAESTLEALAWAQALSHHLLRAVHHLREPAPGDEA
jgi:phosphate:Na+ symporter